MYCFPALTPRRRGHYASSSSSSSASWPSANLQLDIVTKLTLIQRTSSHLATSAVMRARVTIEVTADAEATCASWLSALKRCEKSVS